MLQQLQLPPPLQQPQLPPQLQPLIPNHAMVAEQIIILVVQTQNLVLKDKATATLIRTV